MKDKIECKLLKPFGSTIAKSTMPKELIDDFLKDLYDIDRTQKKQNNMLMVIDLQDKFIKNY